MDGYTVERISYQEAKPWILQKHYAHKLPQVMYAVALVEAGVVVGVVSYGRPSTPQPCKCCGQQYIGCVLELNRLIVESDTRNAASFLIAGSFKLLPRPSILVSYADPNQGHIGYIYQATNWLYTGLGGGSVELYLNGDRLNERTLDHKGIHSKEDKQAYVLARGGKCYQAKPKHRYHYFLGTKSEKKDMRQALRYPVLPYPKGETKRYDASAEFHKQVRMF